MQCRFAVKFGALSTLMHYSLLSCAEPAFSNQYLSIYSLSIPFLRNLSIYQPCSIYLSSPKQLLLQDTGLYIVFKRLLSIYFYLYLDLYYLSIYFLRNLSIHLSASFYLSIISKTTVASRYRTLHRLQIYFYPSIFIPIFLFSYFSGNLSIHQPRSIYLSSPKHLSLQDTGLYIVCKYTSI